MKGLFKQLMILLYSIILTNLKIKTIFLRQGYCHCCKGGITAKMRDAMPERIVFRDY